VKTIDDYKKHLARVADINSASGILSWDQEIYMPPGGGQFRARALSTLAGLSHEMFTDQKFGDLLERLSDDASVNGVMKKNIEKSLRDYRRWKKYPTSFVEEMSRCVSEAFQAWQKAKSENDFQIFKSPLANLIKLKREESDLLGYKEHPYDAHLDLYEPDMKLSVLKGVFEGVRKELVDFVKIIKEKPQVEDGFMRRHYPKDKQWAFGLEVLKQMGYDFNCGRQDISSHPFSLSLNPHDVRVTTRVDEEDLNNMIWSCIHEGGHALYEQGLNPENFGLPAGEAASLGIHESQSRLWENQVGRGKSFWKYFYPKLQSVFSENLGDHNLDAFYKAMNKVEPNFIRTEADELTYHFHIMIRTEVEEAIISGDLAVDDIPDYWNSKYDAYLGIKVPDNRKGVLQDIHWSHGSFGYFPTYSLGSFYAAQFYFKAAADLPNMESDFSRGDFSALLQWLRKNVHSVGRTETSEEICHRVTGEGLNFSWFMKYARGKYSEIYGL
jgi:carboxypeptidase Taq